MLDDLCVSRSDKDHASSFAKHLRALSRMTWAEIGNAPREGLGYERFKHQDIWAKVAKAVPVDSLILVFRPSQSTRLVGYRQDDGTLVVVGLDATPFKTYKHG